MNDETKEIVAQETDESTPPATDQTPSPEQQQPEQVSPPAQADEQPTEQPTEQPAEQPTEQPTEQPAEESAEESARPTEESQPASESAEQEPTAAPTPKESAEAVPSEQDGAQAESAQTAEATPASKRDVMGEIMAFVKKAMAFAQKYIFTTKVCNITLIGLSALAMLVCLLQVVSWGMNIGDVLPLFAEVVTSVSVAAIVEILLLVVFMITLIANIIRGTVSLIKKGHHAEFSAVATLLSFYVVSLAAGALFEQRTSLLTCFPVFPMFRFVLVVMILYSVIKLFEVDLRNRWSALLFSVLSITVILIAYDQPIWSFFSISPDGGAAISIQNYNVIEYLRALRETDLVTVEYQLVELARETTMYGLIIPLELVAILVTNLMPYALMSLLPYLIYGVAGKAYDQYYHLRACKKACVTLLVVFLMPVVAGAILMVMGDMGGGLGFHVTLDYTNIAIVLLAVIGLLILLSLPWSIYKAAYKHHYAVYQKSKGENV